MEVLSDAREARGREDLHVLNICSSMMNDNVTWSVSCTVCFGIPRLLGSLSGGLSEMTRPTTSLRWNLVIETPRGSYRDPHLRANGNVLEFKLIVPSIGRGGDF